MHKSENHSVLLAILVDLSGLSSYHYLRELFKKMGEEMKENSCCFTGHRNIAHWKYTQIVNELSELICGLIHDGITCFYTGGAIGFDTLAAQAVLRAKRNYAHIKLILLLPCESQTRFWAPEDIAEYEEIKKSADEIHYISTQYTKSCMFRRNRALVDSSSICVCYLEKESGGTAYTVRYAISKGLQIVNMAKKQASA